MTSQAIGWNLEAELREIERVLKPNGCAIHLFWNSEPESENKINDYLISSEWNYSCTEYQVPKGIKLKYHKIMK